MDYGIQRRTRGGLREAARQPIDEEGTREIDVLDPAAGRHIRRGSAQAKLDEAHASAERAKRARAAIGPIPDRFPSRGR